MGSVNGEARRGLRQGLRSGSLGLAAIATAIVISSDTASARHHRSEHAHYAHVEHHHRHAHAEEYAPPSASIVVDGNSGAVLEASNPDALRHPASLTKVMTLYLLFERLDAGKIRLDTPLKVSEHAAEQAPTKLDLKPGQTITVEDAIKGIVTKSANDAAVVIAENLGGDEEAFAKTMTQKARALGMTHTTYVNASGLPDDDQVTTARDQALLGRAIQDRFPRYYKYFSTTSFVFHGETIRGHNHLLGSVEGVDGIKTGFTRASGFNLLTSLHRDGRYLIGVVMGGPSASGRDAHMRELLADHFKEAALRRTAPLIADAHENAQPYAFGKAPMTSMLTAASHGEPPATGTVKASVLVGSNDPIKPVPVHTITYRTAPVQNGAMAPLPALVPVAPAPVAPQPVAALPNPRASAPATFDQRIAVASADPTAPIAPPKAQVVAPVPAMPARNDTAKADAAMQGPLLSSDAMPSRAEPAQAARPAAQVDSTIPSTPAHARGGWLIQIGAYEDENEAKQHLTAAQEKLHSALAAKDPFTERIQKGDKAFYRARFAGFDKATAEATCRELKRSDFACMALKD